MTRGFSIHSPTLCFNALGDGLSVLTRARLPAAQFNVTNLSTARRAITKCLLGVVLLLAVPLCLAQSPMSAAVDTLQTIKQRGYINVGHRVSSVPFSFYDSHEQVVGYSHEFALAIVEAIRRQLAEPLLPVRLKPVMSDNRMHLIRSGDIDFECGSTTHNSGRARHAGFSNTIFIVGTRMMTRRDSGIHDFRDLTERKVVTTAGTTSERLLKKLNQQANMRMSVLTQPDHRESFLALESGEVDAFMLDDALLYGELAKADNPDHFMVTGTPQSFEAYACMLPRGDAAFKRLVDDALAQLMRSGDAERIYQRWFMSPLPDSALNLQFPLSDTMRGLFRNPNDHPFQ